MVPRNLNGTGDVSWESLWPVIFHEACLNAVKSSRTGLQTFGSAAAAIVLARCAWEAYATEIVEWRNLPPSIKGASFKTSVKKILFEISETEPSFELDTIWGEMQLLNDLRNAIAHHKAANLGEGESPYHVLTRLRALGVLLSESAPSTWERTVITPCTATWACRTVGRAIITVEKFPSRRVRIARTVINQIQRSLSELGQYGEST
jgi:hypothetical protein